GCAPDVDAGGGGVEVEPAGAMATRIAQAALSYALACGWEATERPHARDCRLCSSPWMRVVCTPAATPAAAASDPTVIASPRDPPPPRSGDGHLDMALPVVGEAVRGRENGPLAGYREMAIAGQREVRVIAGDHGTLGAAEGIGDRRADQERLHRHVRGQRRV